MRLYLIFTAGLFLATALACSTPAPAPAVDQPWSEIPLEEKATELADRHVDIIAGEAWRMGELEAIAEGLDAIPAVLLPTADAPLRIARIDRPCLFGMGRYSSTCPTFADDGTLLLYDVAISHHVDSPTRRLEMLSHADRLRLLRMRSVAHALALRADEKYEWSTSLGWRRINGWNRRGTGPRNRHVGGFLRPMGKRSAQLDLVTSMEAFLFREEDLAARADELSPNFDPNMTFSCQEFTRSRILGAFLDDIDPRWREDTWRDDDQIRPYCRSFVAWADIENVTGVDVLFASEQTSRPESLFGHLLLHIRHDSPQRFRSEGFDYVYQFGALTDPEVDPITYLLRGMTGNFLAIFDLSTFRGVDHNYLQLEQRTLRRYSLNLSDDQLNQLMERIWEAERRLAFPYYFSTHNCASMLLDLIEPVIDEDQSFARRPIAMPTEVLDILAAVEGEDGEPLLTNRPDHVFSAADRALAAVNVQRELLSSLNASAPPELPGIIDDLRSSPPEERAQNYGELGSLLAQAIAEETMDAHAAWTLSESFVDMERAELERANAQLLEYHDRALEIDLSIPLDEVFAMRRDLFRDEDLDRRAREKNEFSRQRFYLFRDAPRRPPSSREKTLLEKRDHLNRSYDAAADAQAQIVSALGEVDATFDPVDFHHYHNQLRRDAQARHDERSLTPSNSNRLRIGLQWPLETPLADIQFAVLDDHLGQRRLHGHRPEIEAVGFAGRLRAPVSDEFYRNLDFQLTILRYITLASRPGATGSALVDRLGWGAEAEVRARNHAIPLSGHAFFGVFTPLLLSPSGVEYLAVGLGPVLSSGISGESNHFSAGLQGYILARKHLAGPYDNSLTIRLRHFEALSPYGWSLHRRGQFRVGVDLFIPMGRQGAIISPHVEYELEQFGGHDEFDVRRVLFGLALEPLIGAGN